MVLIFSDHTDQSTNEVIDWLSLRAVPFLRINNEPLLVKRAEVGHVVFDINGKEIALNDITAVWIRRPEAMIVALPQLHAVEDENLRSQLQQHLEDERQSLSRYIYQLLHTRPSLSSIFHFRVNKLACLDAAQRCGLKIPATLVCHTRAQVLDFVQQYPRIITKGIQESPTLHHNGNHHWCLTQRLTITEVMQLPETFYHSLFQEELPKRYELRIFFLEGRCYSMAIFSQLDEQTQTDFRQYNDARPNRTVPYQLPNIIEQQLGAFMEAMQLNNGSIDMIVTPDKAFYFIEVNPVGQFHMTSKPCRYFLEEKMAQFLQGTHT
jgi:ATP-GRASP peptide maturase of grasp-with-spasm system